MPFARVYAAQPHLINGHIVTVEVDIHRNSLHNFSIVGLPAKEVDEGKLRVSSAIKNSGFTSPKSKNQKTVASLSPADLKKEGAYFDLAVALAYLLADETINFNPEGKIFLGELALNGELKPLCGVLPLAKEAALRGFKEVYVPEANSHEAAIVEGIDVFPCANLAQIIEHLIGKNKLAPAPRTEIVRERKEDALDFSDIRGQETAKRGLAIAAAGGHNVLMIGPPGTGKTLLARAFASLLPDLDLDEILEVTSIHSIAGITKNKLVVDPPFRAPHHSASSVSLIGGGTIPKPGEITLAHRGILFLDEFPEFTRDVLEALREPLEEKTITVSRAHGSASFPANFILIAAMNPCPCGFFGTHKNCTCGPFELVRYKKKVSGPILDRVDLVIEVENIDYEKLSGKKQKPDGLREKVLAAREIQKARFNELKMSRPKTNSDLGVKDLEKAIVLTSDLSKLLNESAAKLDLSPRSYHRIIKLARTIADLEGEENLKASHLLEALQYRPKQKFI